MTTTTRYETEEIDRGYQTGVVERVYVDNGEFEYEIDAFVGNIDYVKLGNAGGNSAHKNYNSPYSDIDWLGHYTVDVILNREDNDRVTEEFFNLKDAVDFYLSFPRYGPNSYAQKVIYQERELSNGARDSNVVRYA